MHGGGLEDSIISPGATPRVDHDRCAAAPAATDRRAEMGAGRDAALRAGRDAASHAGPTPTSETGDDDAMPLPATSAADLRLADAFAAPGCPVCTEVRRSNAQWLESILAESVNDVGFREAFDRSRGLCARHVRDVLDADQRRAGRLGAAILLRATLVARLREIEGVHAAGGWTRSRRAAEAARQPACLGCAREASTLEWITGAIVRLTAHEAWAAAAGTAPFCLDHLVLLLRERGGSAGWAAAEAGQLERLRGLRDLLEGFAHASSHDRWHLQTDEQRAAVDAAAELLAGDVGRSERRGRGGQA